MWPAKLPGEGALLYDACRAMCEVMKELGVAVDGGKDSLSMAARLGEDTIKAPGRRLMPQGFSSRKYFSLSFVLNLILSLLHCLG